MPLKSPTSLPQISRRLLLQTGAFGLAGLSTPGAAMLLQLGGFTHGVASGEPGPDSVLLWTRFEANQATPLTVELSETLDFARIAGGAQTLAEPDRDFIAKPVVTGLTPNRWYFYRFIAPNGAVSQIGRTRTLPDQPVERFNLAVMSCSNMGFGYFNAYAHAAQRGDIDLALHLGDYFYEYGVGTYPDASQMGEGRSIQPDHEILTLADYRLRYASYRADPDLQRLHQVLPVISQWDDHEIANDAWRDGAQNHDPATEGDYATRKRIARRVYREWMPVADVPDDQDVWSRYEIGDLATLFKTESRLSGRDEQVELASAFADPANIAAGLARFRDEQWQDPARRMLGADQASWFHEGMAQSARQGTRWQVWPQQCVMGSLTLPPETFSWIPSDAPDYVRQRAMAGVAASQAGLPFNMDSWDGYPVDRARHLAAAQEADANLIVLSGDSHNAWGFDLANDGAPAGVEFAGQSVTSPGFETFAPAVSPNDIAAALVRSNSGNGLRFADTGHRGYLSVMLGRDQATATWHFLDTIASRSTGLAGEHRASVVRGTNRMMG